MTRAVVRYCLLSVFSFIAVAIHAAEGPSPDVPELKVLAHYIGTWDVKAETANLQFAKGEATAKWILDGRYVEQTGATSAADGGNKVSIKYLMTYDVEAKTYRTWMFSSTGISHSADSVWDEKAKTFTSVTKPDKNGITTTTIADFSVPDVESWKLIVKESSGKVLEEFRGKNTRRK